MKTLGAILLSSRPLSWVNTAFPFAAAYFMTTRELDLVFWIGTFYFLVPYNLAMNLFQGAALVFDRAARGGEPS